ncbi:MAG TPA: serine/threonine-protein kinase, partial [Nocardioides sp.]|nr:serine/threonine-protein kinase [Nocardioides sp.]
MAQGTIAGRYRVVREVGRGGMGAVWLCEDERLGRHVAVKQVGHVSGETAPDVARAMREARSSAPLTHPNVVAIYDAIDEGDRIWLVMEYVDGRTLAQIIAEDGPVPPERVAEIGAQVADGLAAAHRRGTVHRDIKPSNILIGPDGRAKISDFGISRTVGEATLTQTGMLSGTPSYLSPEIARGEDPSPASDVWALGASLFAAVEGRPPYASQPNPLATLQNIVNEPVPRPQRAGAVTEPIVRMMDPDPQSRWAVADAAHALHRIHARHRTDRTREETAAFAGPVGGAAAATTESDPAPMPDPTLEPTPTATPTPQPVRQATPEPAPVPAAAPTRSRRGRGVLLACGILAALVILGALGAFLLNDEPTSPAQDTTEPSADTTQPSPDTGGEPTGDQSSPPDDDGEATGAGSPETFVSDYYAVLPGDTETGWSLLTAGFQREVGSFEDYDAFWSTIDSVTVEDTQPAGTGAVD